MHQTNIIPSIYIHKNFETEGLFPLLSSQQIQNKELDSKEIPKICMYKNQALKATCKSRFHNSCIEGFKNENSPLYKNTQNRMRMEVEEDDL